MSDKESGILEVSIVLPAYNEAETLKNAVEKVISSIERVTSSYEIIIAEDGSTDGTDKIAYALSRKYPFIIHLHEDERLGRGEALKNAFVKSRGRILIYLDVDLATDPRYIPTLVNLIRDGYDLATGSRMLKGSRSKRKFSRKIASKCYNFLVRTILSSKLRDHQCGFKAFKREPLLKVLNEIKSKGWFWDTEAIIIFSRKGYRIKEFPVEWKEGESTKVDILKDSVSMSIQIFKLWWRLKTQHRSRT